MQFEWDEKKSASNLIKHGFDFITASELFLHPHIRIRSDRHGEVRYRAIGRLGRDWVTVAFTYRGEAIRIISVRRARDEEKELYREL